MRRNEVRTGGRWKGVGVGAEEVLRSSREEGGGSGNCCCLAKNGLLCTLSASFVIDKMALFFSFRV